MKVITFAGGLNNNAFTPSTVIDETPAAHRRLPHPRLGRSLPRPHHHAVGARRLAQQRRHRRREDGGAERLLLRTCSPSGSAPRPGSTWPARSTIRCPRSRRGTRSSTRGLLRSGRRGHAGRDARRHQRRRQRRGLGRSPTPSTTIVNPNTGTTTPVVPVTRRVISATAAHTLAHMMVGVVNDPGAEGFKAKIPGYRGRSPARPGPRRSRCPTAGATAPTWSRPSWASCPRRIRSSR